MRVGGCSAGYSAVRRESGDVRQRGADDHGAEDRVAERQEAAPDGETVREWECSVRPGRTTTEVRNE